MATGHAQPSTHDRVLNKYTYDVRRCTRCFNLFLGERMERLLIPVMSDAGELVSVEANTADSLDMVSWRSESRPPTRFVKIVGVVAHRVGSH